MTTTASAESHFGAFVKGQSESLLCTAYLLTPDRFAAEELLQATLVGLYPRWQRVMAADSSLAYVRRSLVNRHLNNRRAKSSGEVLTAAPPDVVVRVDFATRIVDQDQLRRALSLLPDRQRVAIILRYFHDLSDQDAADAIGCRVGTIRSLISRALTSLRADPCLAALDGADPKGAVR